MLPSDYQMSLETLAGSTSQSNEGVRDYKSDFTDGVGGMHNSLLPLKVKSNSQVRLTSNIMQH